MAQESCNLDKEEAEILKPPPSPPAAPPPPHQSSATSQPHLFMNSPQEFTAKMLEKIENQSREQKPAAAAAARLGNRCSSCRKRVGLTGFRCRCGELFCGLHRYSDTHDCSFDYKALGREQILKDNPLVRAAKIIKI